MCFLLIVFSAFSNPIGNPSAPALLEEGCILPDTSWTHPQVGFIGDYIGSKRLRSCHASEDLHIRKGYFSGTAELATFTWNIREKLNLQARAGTGQYSFRWNQMGQNIQGHITGGVVWSGDAKLVVIAIKDTLFSADVQAGGWDFMSGSSTVNAVYSTSNARSKLRYWQTGFAFTQLIGIFSPYLGYAVNASRFEISNLPTGTGHLHAKHKSGPFGGVTLTTGNRFSGNFEWRSFFEEGVSLSVALRF